MLLSAVVSVDGIPVQVRVKSGLGAGIDEEAILAVRRWRFKPGTKDNEPVAVEIRVVVNFEYHGLNFPFHEERR